MSADRGIRLVEGVERRLLATADVSSSDIGVYTIIAAIMAVGVILVLIAAWLFKATKPEMELLAPLERMSDRSWKRLDPAMQRRELDVIRPPGARPIERSTQVPSIDEEFEKPVPDIASFDDLTSMQAADARRRATAVHATTDGPDGPDGQDGHDGHDGQTPDVDTPFGADDTAESDPPDLVDIAQTPPDGVPMVVVTKNASEQPPADDTD